MISKFITSPRSVQLLTRCISNAKYCTTRKLPEQQKQSQATVRTISKPSYGQKISPNIAERTEKSLPEYPEIEGILSLDVESFLRSNYRLVKYGDYEYTECKEGYVQIHIKGYVNDRDVTNVTAGYGVCYGKEDHPLNFGGRVLGEATLRNAHLVAIAEALESLPTDSFKKVCICTSELAMIKAMKIQLPKWAENNYHLSSNPTLRCRNVETLKKLNEFVRVNPFTYRFKYTPSDCNIQMMKFATKLAMAGALN